MKNTALPRRRSSDPHGAEVLSTEKFERSHWVQPCPRNAYPTELRVQPGESVRRKNYPLVVRTDR
jgi:hypothetical protein